MRNHKARHRRGLMAEWLALIPYVLRGYLPIARRYKTPHGEIDLVLIRGNILVCAEVKARHTLAQGAEAIHPMNQQRVVRAAQAFLQHQPRYAECMIRFDAVMVPWYSVPYRILNAFGA